MNRNEMLKKIASQDVWDIVVIGGGASGLGIALDAISRGYKTLLVEQGDFAQGTSSRSTNLIHGGVRYLRSGEINLVRKALKERYLLLKNAPHIVHPIEFVLPTSSFFKRIYYYLGIKLYDLLAYHMLYAQSKMVSKLQLKTDFPNVATDKFDGGISFFDGQFNDARMAINLAQTIVDEGGAIINYMKVTSLLKNQNKIVGVKAIDCESNQEFEINSKVVINATGVFSDSIRRLESETVKPSLIVSQGAHIVLDESFFKQPKKAIIIPETEDGRVLFFIPIGYKKVVVGTTDTLIKDVKANPKPLKEEVDYLLNYAGKFLVRKPSYSDIKSAYAGLRPLVINTPGVSDTSIIPRDYVIDFSEGGLVTVLGGKWTVFRKMGEDTLDSIEKKGVFPPTSSRTKGIKIHGWISTFPSSINEYYGSDKQFVESLANGNPEMLEPLHPDLPLRMVDVLWGIRQEMARTLEDILSHRTRCLHLNAKACVEVAPKVAAVLAHELNRNSDWETLQIQQFTTLAQDYIV